MKFIFTRKSIRLICFVLGPGINTNYNWNIHVINFSNAKFIHCCGSNSIRVKLNYNVALTGF